MVRRAPAPIERPLQLVVLVLLGLLAFVLRPVMAAIAVGGFIVLVANPTFERLVERLQGRRRTAAAIGTAAVVIILVVPMAAITTLAIREASAGISWLAGQIEAVGGLHGVQAHLPRSLARLLPDLVQRGAAELGQLGAQAAVLAPELLSSLGLFAAQLFLTVVTVYYLFLQGPAFVDFVRRISPLRPAHTEALLAEFGEVAQGLFWGNLVAAGFHGVAGGLGYLIVGVPKVFFLGAVTALASFVPGFGTAVVWVPIALGLALTGHGWRALLLLAWGMVVIGGIDHVLRPLASRGGMKLPNLLMFLTLFGGVMMFGIKGLLLGPLFGSLAVTGLRLVAREQTRGSPDVS